MSKNTLKRFFVILTLLVSILLLAIIVLNVFEFYDILSKVNLQLDFEHINKDQLNKLDAPAMRLSWLIAGWIGLQIIFFFGLLIHFFNTTKNNNYQVTSKRGRKSSDSDDSDSDAIEEFSSKTKTSRRSRRHKA
ncbi:hypothetical protein ACVR0S_00695 [Streptococcus dentapri]|uniref:Uncharacterized protein n=1 Tax=Streptococcus dentapri TaxID=573564 RepID=A0ABV8D0B0_9STRE